MKSQNLNYLSVQFDKMNQSLRRGDMASLRGEIATLNQIVDYVESDEACVPKEFQSSCEAALKDLFQ